MQFVKTHELFVNVSGTDALLKTNSKLHPSWEASRKRKAEQAGIGVFKGSRKTFDDDD